MEWISYRLGLLGGHRVGNELQIRTSNFEPPSSGASSPIDRGSTNRQEFQRPM